MYWETFKEKVQLEASVPKMGAKWFRLSKFIEEFAEFATSKSIENIDLELQDTMFTLALLLPFSEEIETDVDIFCDNHFESVVWGLQIYNKKNKKEFSMFVCYMETKLLHWNNIEQVLDRAYERLISAKFI